MNLLKDYDCKILYHLNKENMVANAISRKGISLLAHLMVFEWKLLEYVQGLEIKVQKRGVYLTNMRVQLTLIQKIKEAQMVDPTLQSIKRDTE